LTLQQNSLKGLEKIRDAIYKRAATTGLSPRGNKVTDAQLTTFAGKSTGDDRTTYAGSIYTQYVADCNSACNATYSACLAGGTSPKVCAAALNSCLANCSK
jgi:hypothetical protein